MQSERVAILAREAIDTGKMFFCVDEALFYTTMQLLSRKGYEIDVRPVKDGVRSYIGLYLGAGHEAIQRDRLEAERKKTRGLTLGDLIVHFRVRPREVLK